MMADMNPMAPATGGTGAPATSNGATAPQTRQQIMAAIKSAPTVTPPTVHSPTAPATEKPAPVEAVRLEVGGAASGAASGGDQAQTHGEAGENETTALEAQDQLSQEPIDYAQKYQEIMDSGDLHESLFDKMVIAKPNGVETPITIKEALSGYMRRSDHSRAMNEVQQLDHTVKAEKQQIANLWDSLKGKPELALEVFGERFGDSWLDQIVQHRQAAVEAYEGAILDAGHRVVAQLGINPQHAAQDPRVIAAMSQAKERLDRQKTLESENRALKRKAEEFEKAQAAASSKQEEASYGDRFQATIKRFSDAALKAEGIPVNPLTSQELQQVTAQLLIAKNQSVAESKRDYTITQDLVREAASIIKETREDARRGETQEPPLPQRQGMGVGSGALVKPNGGPQTRRQLMDGLRGRR